VQFYELDSAGIVHFSWYFRYLEEAEHALWRAAGLSIAPRGATVGFPRVSAAFEYHRPLRFEDEFEVLIRVTSLDGSTMRYRCLISRGGERIARGDLAITCVSKRAGEPMKAMPFPADIAARFRPGAEGDEGA